MKETDLPAPGETDVLIRMHSVGVCGSDLHRFNCDWPLTAPMTLGHEAAGVIEAAGSAVRHLAVALHGVEQAEVKPGRTAAVLGAGVIGLLCIMCLRACGVTRIIAADLFENRLQAAERAGATHTVNSGQENLAQSVHELTGGEGVDYVFEVTGSAKVAALTPHIVAPGGVIVEVGVVTEAVSLDFRVLLNKEAALKQFFKYRNNFKAALSLIQGGLPVETLITHTFPFHMLENALTYVADHPDQCLKALIAFDT